MAGEAEDLKLVLALPALRSLLATVKNEGLSIYAALYELNDPELIGLLAGLGLVSPAAGKWFLLVRHSRREQGRHGRIPIWQRPVFAQRDRCPRRPARPVPKFPGKPLHAGLRWPRSPLRWTARLGQYFHVLQPGRRVDRSCPLDCLFHDSGDHGITLAGSGC